MKFLLVPLLISPLLLGATCAEWAKPESKALVLKTAKRSLLEAGRKILALRDKQDFQLEQKRNFSDLKTLGDCTSQNTIFAELKKDSRLKNAQFLGEEKCSSAPEEKVASSPYTWILDPIDGTTNYAHGMPHFSISLALVADKTVCFGAVYSPVYGEFFYAFAGSGAFLQKDGKETKIQPSQIANLNSSLWITGTEGGPAPKAKEKNSQTFEIAKVLLPQTHDLRRTGSAALDLASVASGRVEAYYELGEGLNWWDIAAGILLVSEAGGKVWIQEPAGSSAQNSADLSRPIVAIVATNGQESIHRAITSLLAKTK